MVKLWYARSAMIAIVSACAVAEARAQEVAGDQAEAEGARGQLEEIVVTAQRRDENLQKVPIAISAVTAEGLARSGVQTAQDVQMVVPGLVYTRSGFNATPFIRGVGRISSTPGTEFPVAQYIDGVYQAASPGTLTGLNNIERVEVLKGPQGTLFGRNATGGLIHVITRDPQQAFGLDAELGYGNFDTLEGRLYATGGIAPSLAADLAVYYHDQSQGWGFNATTGQDVRKGKDIAIRSKLLMDVGDRTKLTLSGFYTESDGDIGVYSLAPGAVAVNGAVNTGFFDVQDVNNSIEVENRGIHFRLDQELGFANFVNIFGYQHLTGDLFGDADGAAAQILQVRYVVSQKTLTNEMQLLARDDSPVKWILGFFYMRDVTDGLTFFSGSGFPTSPVGDAYQTVRSYAPFGQATVPVSDRTRLTLGLRYTIDEISIQGRETTAAGATVFAVDQNRTFKRFTYRAAIDHDLADNILLYASYNRGFKSAGFNVQSSNLPALEPEVLDAFEIGFKSELFDRRARFNVSAFYYDYTNMIVRANNPLTSRVQDINAASSEIKGIDAELLVSATNDLTFSFGAAYLDAKYKVFPGATFSTRRPTGGNIIVLGNAAGRRLLDAPEFTFQSGVDYNVTLGASRLRANVNYAYTSEFYFGADNRFEQPSKHIVNATLTFYPNDSRLSIKGWARNLLNERYVQQANVTAAFGDTIAPGAPRTYGVTLGYRF